MAFVQLQDLSKRYGDLDAVVATNLSVEKGEFVSLLGPSGCGKTTTLQMIAGFVEASSGRILLDGRDITHAKPASRGLGVVFQSYALFPHMSVKDNVAFGLRMRKVPSAELQSRVDRVLKLVRLDRHAERYPRELSGGQRQRVALARALVIEPPVLLLDEPLSNLDANLREEMQFEIRRIQREVGITTLMVTHDQSEALSISDRSWSCRPAVLPRSTRPTLFMNTRAPSSSPASSARPTCCPASVTAPASCKPAALVKAR